MIDAYTETDRYPYARHYTVDGNESTIYATASRDDDAYDGSVAFTSSTMTTPSFVRTAICSPRFFPRHFADAGRFTRPRPLPETLLNAQADAYGLYIRERKSLLPTRRHVERRRETGLEENSRERSAPARTLFRVAATSARRPRRRIFNIVAFTPASRDNLIGWMAGRSDGAAYGSLLVYKFPKSKLVNGPLQVNARIDQNAQLSSQLTLWNQQGSRVQRGNLLIIPLGRGLLYVQTIYLQATLADARTAPRRPASQSDSLRNDLRRSTNESLR